MKLAPSRKDTQGAEKREVKRLQFFAGRPGLAIRPRLSTNLLTPSQAQFIVIARVIRPQGRRGEVAAEIMTDFPERFRALNRIYLAARPDEENGASPLPVALERAWPHKGRIILKLAGIDSITEAETLRGRPVMIPYEERIALPEGAYYTSELEGCRVVSGPPDARREIGDVITVEPTGGTPLLRVSRAATGRGEVLIPLAREICREIDPGARLIVIDPPEDLLELNERAPRGSQTS